MKSIEYQQLGMKEPPIPSKDTFYEVEFQCENEQSRIREQETIAVSDLGSIFQKVHAKIEPGAYLKADRSLLFCDNIIIREEKDSKEEADETRSTITFEQYSQGSQDLLNYVAGHHQEAFHFLNNWLTCILQKQYIVKTY